MGIVRALTIQGVLLVPLLLAACAKTPTVPVDASEDAEPTTPLEESEDWSCGSSANDWIDVAVSHAGTCGLKRDGRVLCWPERAILDPPQEPIPGAKHLAMNGLSLCVIGESNVVSCFGNPLDDATNMPPERLEDVELAHQRACGVSEGLIVCWGEADGAGLLDSPSEQEFTEVCLGRHFGCGLNTEGGIRCWGDVKSPIVDPIVGQFSQISCGRLQLCALDADGSIHWWGVGHGRPEHIVDITHIECSALETCAVHHGGVVDCWDPFRSWRPTGEHVFKEINGSTHRYCGVDLEGRIHCWGRSARSKVCPP